VTSLHNFLKLELFISLESKGLGFWDSRSLDVTRELLASECSLLHSQFVLIPQHSQYISSSLNIQALFLGCHLFHTHKLYASTFSGHILCWYLGS